jgi:hypothetical protein
MDKLIFVHGEDFIEYDGFDFRILCFIFEMVSPYAVQTIHKTHRLTCSSCLKSPK